MRTLPAVECALGLVCDERAVAQHGQHQQAEDRRLQEQQQGVAPVAGDDGQVTADEGDELVPPARVGGDGIGRARPHLLELLGFERGAHVLLAVGRLRRTPPWPVPGSPRSRCWNTSAYCSRPKNCRVGLGRSEVGGLAPGSEEEDAVAEVEALNAVRHGDDGAAAVRQTAAAAP